MPGASLLDCWQSDGTLYIGVYTDGIDLGTQCDANFVELAALQHRVADEVGSRVGSLTTTIKPAHVYDTALREVVADAKASGASL